MHSGSLYHGDIISAFQREVPDCYVRDYRGGGGWITICRGYKDLPWKSSSLTNRKQYVQVPAHTLMSIPRGEVKAADTYNGLALIKPGWRRGLRMAAKFLTYEQRRRIQKRLRAHVWADIAPWR